MVVTADHCPHRANNVALMGDGDCPPEAGLMHRVDT